MPHSTPLPSRAADVIRTGLIAGVADATGATVHFLANGGTDPSRIFIYIASAVFGPAAANGGIAMVATGLLFHFCIAMGWTVVYFVGAARLPLLRTRIVPSAILYGAFVWLVMNRVVVPLTRIVPRPFNPTQAAIAAGVLMLCIGLPNAVGVRRYYKRVNAMPEHLAA